MNYHKMNTSIYHDENHKTEHYQDPRNPFMSFPIPTYFFLSTLYHYSIKEIFLFFTIMETGHLCSFGYGLMCLTLYWRYSSMLLCLTLVH